MNEEPRFGIDPDAEADKLLSPYLARQRHGIPDEPDEDHPKRSTVPRVRKPRHSRRGGRSLPEKSGQDISREIANAAAISEPDSRTRDEIRADYGRGGDLARSVLSDVKPVSETEEQKLARQAAEGAALADAARKSWEEIEKSIK